MIQSVSKIKSNNNFFSSGWICVNKPMNLSSFDVVRRLKKIFSLKKVGHAGTLDPLATGILPIAFGNATKTIPYLVSSKKKYSYFFYTMQKEKRFLGIQHFYAWKKIK